MNYPPLPPATVLKLEPTKAVYRAFRLVSSPLKAPAKPDTPSTSRMLTPSEIEQLRQEQSDRLDLLQKEFPKAKILR